MIWNFSEEMPILFYNIGKCQESLTLLKYQNIKLKHLSILDPVGNISINKLNIHFAHKTVTDSSININILPKSKVSLLGPSGSGKSSVIKALVGLSHNYSGEIFFDNIN